MEKFNKLKKDLREKDIQLERIRDKVLFILAEFKEKILNDEKIEIDSKKILDLYEAAELKEEYKDVRLFLSKEVIEGFIICQAFRMFRKHDSTERDSLEEKLEDLYEACLVLNKFNEWQDSFNMQPQDLKFSNNKKNFFKKLFNI